MAVHVADKLDSERKNTSFTGKLLCNRCGNFFALSASVSCDLGLKKPKVVGQANAKNAVVINRLLVNSDVVRLAGFQSAVFYHCQPTLYHQYAENRTALTNNQPHLTWNFRNSIYTHVTFNFGPQTVCAEHTNFGNQADGPCAITALSPSVGGYDYKKGGHLILWDLCLVIEFPPSATILILSAVLHHSNVAIGANERWFSFTQYTPGSLFRWVEHGHQLELEFWASLMQDQAKAERAKDKARWKSALVNFTRHAL
ncbi:hypothetical protein Moror_15864 [Moniliophthora roreri MCA 2997]|uniref:Uncharacterized protein n=1 Tax=Moniliophthora roreri (strain MCA 2997) TaxID=1381753 RepID=V2XN47_MONRO|nr:hypothetical protein Moror_15864 [Moniliophthora roreri MCA 2997]